MRNTMPIANRKARLDETVRNVYEKKTPDRGDQDCMYVLKKTTKSERLYIETKPE